MKFLVQVLRQFLLLSLPPRGAWIEINNGNRVRICVQWSLPPRGAWIEISGQMSQQQFQQRRSPHGERGLKLTYLGYSPGTIESLPPRGAWIEIWNPLPGMVPATRRSPHGERGLKSEMFGLPISTLRSLPPRGAWIEMSPVHRNCQQALSLPPRGAWIEILASPPFARPPLPKGEARGAVHLCGVFMSFREFDRIRRGKLLGNGQTSENSQHWIFIQISR